MSKIMASSRDPERLLDIWVGWRTIAYPMRSDFERYVELANEGARGLGFADLGAMWRSKYDMDPDAFAAEVDRLWQQMRPLYESLHCYVRSRLAATYGEDLVPLDGPIPAHLLGNMWAQSWSNIYPLVGLADADPGYDLTELLSRRDLDPVEMARIGEAFFSSLGFEPLPQTFWERSMFTKPRDREVVCHASAWDIDAIDDLRIKMCIEPTEEDFVTIHHELGHNYYQRAYSRLDPLYRDSANDGFHEAVGDTLALSITPAYLVKLGFLDEEPETDDVGMLLRLALDKIAFLPFGLLVDQYRWRVFSGEIGPEEYNSAWWELRQRYQGVRPPVERTEAQLDPGAKYHVPANVPYTRYFLAGVLQFQMHRALCETAGYEGPLHRCSIYGSSAAGTRLAAMLEMGLSRPWPDALEALGAGREMDATAILDYFAPLKEWLDEQNEGMTCGW
jgi:peptidyl-dipeptidase A